MHGSVLLSDEDVPRTRKVLKANVRALFGSRETRRRAKMWAHISDQNWRERDSSKLRCPHCGQLVFDVDVLRWHVAHCSERHVI